MANEHLRCHRAYRAKGSFSISDEFRWPCKRNKVLKHARYFDSRVEVVGSDDGKEKFFNLWL